MKKELELALFARHPHAFKLATAGDPRWQGIDVENGWFDLLDVTLEKMFSPLRSLEAQRNDLENAGRRLRRPDVVAAQLAQLDALEAQYVKPVVEHIKETRGELRIFLHEGFELGRSALNFAETFSTRICCLCGAPGEKRLLGNMQLRTLCDAHAPAPDAGSAADVLRAIAAGSKGL